eukprot:CAMPEP_0177752430 /NCGR_PEP_ID=MMETSP0491_2-20121128/918_1 /TAXON_ID=63592 /ORGANISM="Tetraselmis chuii, Strain PLY429" /LENGTH=49 /DNA_ID=CAMNT_0019267639 /DNA_START=832 /DNA_END=981 /DNA_ORIENTATION=+
MPLPLLPQSAATSIDGDARKALSDENGETGNFIHPFGKYRNPTDQRRPG